MVMHTKTTETPVGSPQTGALPTTNCKTQIIIQVACLTMIIYNKIIDIPLSSIKTGNSRLYTLNIQKGT
jgi:hypothetical protein